MSGILITVRTVTLGESEFNQVMDELLQYVIDISPKNTGFFSSQWELSVDYPDATLTNDTEYGEYLDDGHSDQAPSGVTQPALEYLRELVNGYS